MGIRRRPGADAAAARAQGGNLKVVTTQDAAGILQKNGVPYGANAVLTEYFSRTIEPNGDSWLILTSIVEDPQYLTGPFLRSTHYKRLPDNNIAVGAGAMFRDNDRTRWPRVVARGVTMIPHRCLAARRCDSGSVRVADAARHDDHSWLQVVAAGTFHAARRAEPGAATRWRDLPAFCRVARDVEAVERLGHQDRGLAACGELERKFQAVGNGAWTGAIGYAAMADALRRGYATSSTDTGHVGGSASFAMGHPEKADRLRAIARSTR